MDTNIERFLNNEMNEKERKLFLEEINSNEELKKTIDIYKEMQAIYSDTDWEIEKTSTKHPKIIESLSFLRGEKGENIKNVIAEEANHYFSEKPKSQGIRKLFLIASSIAAIFIIGFSLWNTNETNTDLYAEFNNNWKELPSLTLRGSNDDFITIEKLFKEKKYEESLLLLEKLQLKKQASLDFQILMYEGVLNLELSRKDKAIHIFENLLQSNSLDAFKAHWYLALLYLKENDLKKAKRELQFILSDKAGFKDKEAQKLLSKLAKMEN